MAARAHRRWRSLSRQLPVLPPLVEQLEEPPENEQPKLQRTAQPRLHLQQLVGPVVTHGRHSLGWKITLRVLEEPATRVQKLRNGLPVLPLGP